NHSLAVVGSRQASPYGIDAAKVFAGGLAREGLTVVSGFATGVDRAAHLAALEGGGRTIAVLGCGLDIDYPSKSMELKEMICAQGAVISEFPMGTQPYPSNFPRRNRVISGISLGVLVVEAALKSGSLVTASAALEQGREIFAVPGSFNNPLSKGTHRLIQSGAKLVTEVSDILDEIDVHLGSRHERNRPEVSGKARENPGFPLDPDEKTIYDILTVDPVYLDDLSRKSGFAVSRCSEILLILELKGLIHRMEGNRFMTLQAG
ncbi:MAG TPA: DNA-processing protein DprA, partial [Nitrospiria bacterium]|nr:DNA-processing protein DprA [Nitrospiria bacterium]